MSKALITFVKNPIKGKVKTRLAKDIGEDEALKVYLRLLAHTRNTVIGGNWDNHLFYSENIVKEDEWYTDDFSKHLQCEGDLGDKMKHAFALTLRLASKVIIIGSDCPEISADIIETAFKRLDIADIVLGPTLDGGYYLIGMKCQNPSLFEDISWSTESVFSQTIEKIQSLGLLYTKMPTLSDLDYKEDLDKFDWLSRG